MDAQDRIAAWLRALTLLAGLLFVLASTGTDPEARRSVLLGLGAFATYSLVLYGLTFPRLVEAGRKGTFYALTSGLDLLLTAWLMHRTGGGTSPLYRALYVWVAVLAFNFGRAGGLVGSALSLAIYLGFHVAQRFEGDTWNVAVQAGGLLMHGPLIGTLVDRWRQRADELREANQRLVEEQQAIIRAEKLSSIGLLAASVAHEINNPLSGVMGCVKALRDGAVAEDRRDEYFETVRDGLERIRLTVQGLLEYARQRPPARAELDLRAAIDSALRLVGPAARKKSLDVTVAVGPGAERAHADEAQVLQALVNLLVNAIYAVPPGSEVAVSTSRRGERTAIVVRDRGPGIPPELLARLGSPFLTTKPVGEGTGLGLAITMAIARQNGGELELESEVGRGTTATLWLPATSVREREVQHA